jgi:hypothetical protein
MSSERSREQRRLAAGCLAIAKQTSDAKVRAFLLDMAQKWLDLAELCEQEAWNQTLCVRTLRAAIGEELRMHYELPKELPHRLLALPSKYLGGAAGKSLDACRSGSRSCPKCGL